MMASVLARAESTDDEILLPDLVDPAAKKASCRVFWIVTQEAIDKLKHADAPVIWAFHRRDSSAATDTAYAHSC